jgi:thiol-disulfide isomerase/thioredoxin
MQKRFSILVVLLAFVSTAITAQNRSIEFDHSAFKDILAKAKKENKMIYIDCYTAWCGPCKWMAKNVFTNDTVADFYNKNFINTKIDMEKGEGIELAKKYQIRAYPTMLFLNSDGVQLHRTCGSTSVKNFISIGGNALSPNTQLATYAANFNNGNVSSAAAATYFSMLENACQSFNPELEKYFSAQKESELVSANNWKLFYNYVNYDSLKWFRYFEANKSSFSKLYTNDSVDYKINQVYSGSLYFTSKNKDKKEYEATKARFRKLETKDGEKTLQYADMNLYEREQDWANYAKAACEYIPKYAEKNVYELNRAAWSFYEHIDDKTILAKAEAWAKQAAEIDDSYAINDTYAAVLYKTGKKEEAKATAQKAIDLAKKTGEDSKETEALLKKIIAMK